MKPSAAGHLWPSAAGQVLMPCRNPYRKYAQSDLHQFDHTITPDVTIEHLLTDDGVSPRATLFAFRRCDAVPKQMPQCKSPFARIDSRNPTKSDSERSLLLAPLV
jgi:hypothetical protein